MIGPRDQLKIDIISKVINGLINQKMAAKIMGVSRRTIIRWKKEYLKKGVGFLIHGNTGRKGPNSKSPEYKEKILKAISEDFFDFNVKHAHEKIKELGFRDVSYRTLLRWCHEKNFIRKLKKRRKKIHRIRERMPQRGLMLQMDGSYHSWFGNRASCLIGAIDDADNDLVYGEFFDSESTLNCMKVIQKIIQAKGTFNIPYVDRVGVYGGNKRTDFSQLESSCREIGIQVIYAYSPEAKGRIERVWRTLQGRLIPEMRLRNIHTFEEANKFLQNDFLPNQYRKKFTVIPTISDSAFGHKYSEEYLNEIFCFKETRTIYNDQTFSYRGRKFKIIENFDCSRGVVEIRLYQNKRIKFFFKDRPITVSGITKEGKKAA